MGRPAGRPKCKVDGCSGTNTARGWCNLHYRRWQRTGDPLKAAWERGDTEANFWAKVRRPADDACWPWVGYVNPDGYGVFVSSAGQLAHRYAYQLAHGSIPDGMDLDHACHSGGTCVSVGKDCPHRRCVNPAHLRPISPIEHKGINKPGVRGAAMAAIQRAKTHCPQGHEYTEANTYIDKRGSRNCRACHTEKARQAGRQAYFREYYLRQKAKDQPPS